MDKTKFMVYVSCMTYNQSSYIKDALDSFCMQQTDFPFVCGVIDDASTDGEPNLLLDYLKEHFELDDETREKRDETQDCVRIFARHKTNSNCYFVVVLLKYNHRQIKKTKIPYTAEWRNTAKYIAINEGDDYWIDPMKLQKQVDFMESHPEHSLCFCAHKTKNPEGKEEVIRRYATNIDCCPMEDIIFGGGGFMATNSMLYRQSLYVPHTTWSAGCPIGDAPIMLSLAAKGHVGYLADVMCVYRIMAKGSWTTRMNNSFSDRRKHHKSIIRMWHQFDEWSERKYHKIVMKKLRYNKKEFLKDVIITKFNNIFNLK